MKKKILILGGNGFIGKNFFNKYKKKYFIKKFGKYSKNKKINLSNLKKINVSFDVIIDCSGSSSVKGSIENPQKDYIKTIKSFNEIEKYLLLYNKKIKYIYISSLAVYGNTNGKKLRPISPYGKNKVFIEKKLISISNKNKIELFIIRFGSLFGNGQKKQLLWDTLNKIFKNEDLLFHGTGEELRSWIHISDAIKLIDICIQKNIKYNKIIDVKSKYTIENKKIIYKIFKILNIKKKPKFNQFVRAGDPINLVTNNKKNNSIKWRAKKKLIQGLRDYIKWFKKIKK